jgi:hypothetical protein
MAYQRFTNIVGERGRGKPRPYNDLGAPILESYGGASGRVDPRPPLGLYPLGGGKNIS